MKKFALIVAVLCCLFLAGCSWLPGDFEKDTPGSSTDNLVPMGDFVQIPAERNDTIKFKIADVIGGEAAQELTGLNDTQLIIVKLTIDVSELDSGNFSPDPFELILENGQTVSDTRERYDLEETLEAKHISDVSFGDVGTVDCYTVFHSDIDDCRSLRYYAGYSLFGNKYVYFALA